MLGLLLDGAAAFGVPKPKVNRVGVEGPELLERVGSD
jgi:hypothetical protein